MSFKIFYNGTNVDDSFYMSTYERQRMEYWFAVRAETLEYLTSQDRAIFFPIFLIFYIISFFANICAIYVTYNRKHRWIQKTCIISLSLTDLITATAYTVNYLETFSHPLINWTLGNFMCSFIPLVQTFGVTASCAALVAIALDRYRNVVNVLSKKWNPSLWICMTGAGVIWIMCTGVAYPMYEFFSSKRILVVYLDEDDQPTSREEMYLCISDQKEELKIYYISITSLIFMPMIAMFVWLYYNVAKLIWMHRKPLSFHVPGTGASNMNSSGAETSISQIKSNEDSSRIFKNPNPSPSVSRTPLPKKKNLNVERKIRTFKIIISLVIIFIACRLPYHVFNIDKLVNNHREHEYWIMVYAFNGFGLLNCALDPFLYTFLYPTLSTLAKIRKAVSDFTCKVCCCCFSNTEFEDFEKRNPFIVDVCDKAPTRTNSPHLVKRNSRVKFDDVATEIAPRSQDVFKEKDKDKDMKKY